MLIKRSEWLARIALVMVTSVGITTAIWLIPASVHIVGWRANSAIRAALFAPWSRWWTAFAGVTAVAVFGELLRLRLGTALVRAGRMRFRLAPLLWLWLWVVPYLPWVPDRAPALLALAGPLRWVVAACAVLAALGPSIKAVSIKLVASFNPSSSAGTPPFAPRPRTIFAISLVIYLVLGFQFQSFYGLGGDEPHYLIITHSLLVDHDLDIANNHERRDFRAFFPGELRPDYLRRGQHGEIYSIHAPGLPALLLPGYALAGARGAVATMAFLGALTATAVFTLAALLSGELTALLVWAVVCLTIPFVPHAWMIYPELPGALIVAWATLWLWGRPPSRRELLLRGSVLAVLPWLHTKFVVLLVLFVAFEVVRLWFRGRRAHMTDVRLGLIKDIAIFLVPIAVSTIGWLALFYNMYGVLDPEAPYGSYTELNVLAQNIPRGVLGLLFDQKFGLLVFSPVYLLAGAGLWFMLKEPRLRAFAAALTLTIAAFLAGTTRLYMWWGGSSAPARFLVPVLPLLAPMLAVAFTRLREGIGRVALATTFVVSLAISAVCVLFPEQLYLFSDPHGFARLIQALQGDAPLDVSLPTFTDENWHAPAWLLLRWLASVAASLALVRAWVVMRAQRFSVGHATSALVLAIVVGGLITSNLRSSTREGVITRGQLSLMEALDGGRLWAYGYNNNQRLSKDQLLSAATLALRPGVERQEGPDAPTLAGPFRLPPGHYEARVWFEGDRPRRGQAFVALTSEVHLAEATDPLTNPVKLGFDIPLQSPLSVGVSSTELARDVTRVEVAPTSIVPLEERTDLVAQTVEPLEGKKGYLVYADENAFPEHGIYWTRDSARGVVYIVPHDSSTLTLVLHVGPNGGPVEVRVREAIEDSGRDTGRDRPLDVNLGRDETREVTIPISEKTALIRVAVRASSAFRPAAVDPGSDDQRSLGCQVRPLLR